MHGLSPSCAVAQLRDGKVTVSREPLDDMPDDLRELFEEKPRP